jgi:hypothetical protein
MVVLISNNNEVLEVINMDQQTSEEATTITVSTSVFQQSHCSGLTFEIIQNISYKLLKNMDKKTVANKGVGRRVDCSVEEGRLHVVYSAAAFLFARPANTLPESFDAFRSHLMQSLYLYKKQLSKIADKEGDIVSICCDKCNVSYHPAPLGHDDNDAFYCWYFDKTCPNTTSLKELLEKQKAVAERYKTEKDESKKELDRVKQSLQDQQTLYKTKRDEAKAELEQHKAVAERYKTEKDKAKKELDTVKQSLQDQQTLYETKRDEAKAELATVKQSLQDQQTLAERYKTERDEAKEELATVTADRDHQKTLVVLADERKDEVAQSIKTMEYNYGEEVMKLEAEKKALEQILAEVRQENASLTEQNHSSLKRKSVSSPTGANKQHRRTGNASLGSNDQNDEEGQAEEEGQDGQEEIEGFPMPDDDADDDKGQDGPDDDDNAIAHRTTGNSSLGSNDQNDEEGQAEEEGQDGQEEIEGFPMPDDDDDDDKGQDGPDDDDNAIAQNMFLNHFNADPLNILDGAYDSEDFENVNPYLPDKIIGELHSKQETWGTTHTRTCPWCNRELEGIQNEKHVDLLSDLNGLSTSDHYALVRHETKTPCMFWGIRITKMHKIVTDRCKNSPRILIHKYVTDCTFKARKKKQTIAFVEYQDTGSKEALEKKIKEIMGIAKDSVKNNPLPEVTANTTPYTSLAWLFKYYTGEAPPQTHSREWIRNIIMVLLRKIEQMMLSTIGKWEETTWNADRFRLINDINLSLFCYEYFWYSSVLYTCLDMDKLVPFRDVEKERLYKKQNGKFNKVQLIKGPHGKADHLFMYRHAPVPPYLGENMPVPGYSKMETEDGIVLVPTKVLTDYPFWAEVEAIYVAGTLSARQGFQCGIPDCHIGVTCLKHICSTCRRVFCSSNHFTLLNDNKYLCKNCVSDFQPTKTNTLIKTI